MPLSGFFLKKKPPSSTIEKSICIPETLYVVERGLTAIAVAGT